ncbi:MAG TPA: TIGR03618 family F420-dependent PPOX class oxidoreductase [Blastocatellia bacterium]|nr:TIGR03618 family F420-dependent PPOX class oxidoreductase [Blastocatellia bacterium]
MSAAEVAAFLNERHTMSVATNGRDGYPHVMAMWYGFLDGKPAFWTYAKSQKVRNLERDDRITLMVEDGDTYATLRGVMLTGRARIFRDAGTVMKVGESVHERYNGPVTEQTRPAVEQMGRKRVAVCIEVERVVSWDHRKLSGY